jgi:signal transduction histidine kinase
MPDMANDAVAIGSPPTPAVHSRRLTTGVFVFALLLLAGIAVASYLSVLANAEHSGWVDHTYQVIRTADRLLLDQQDTAAGERGYLLTGKQEFLEQYQHARDRIVPDLDTLAALTADNPHQQARLATLRTLSAQRLQQLDALNAGARLGSLKLGAAQTAEVETSKHVMDQLRAIIGAFVQEEDNLLAERSAETEQSRRLVLQIIAAGNAVSLSALVLCLLLLTRQIRERRAAEARVLSLNETLAQRAAQLELANRELEGFSYSISHDLRSPLRAIDGFAQMLERKYQAVLDAEGLRLLGVVRDNSKRMGALIEDLLAFARLGTKPVVGVATDMQALVRECAAEALLGASPVPELTVGSLPPCWGDRALLKQVWLNLIGNAVKYSSHGPRPRIEISADRDGGYCVYSVRDNGVGFDMQYYDKLFGVFQRLHRMDEFSGTGVGLAIVMRIVTRHGGRIWAEAAVDQGATFYFTIPSTEAHP